MHPLQFGYIMAAIYDDKSLQDLHPWDEAHFSYPNFDLDYQKSFKLIVHGINKNDLHFFANNAERSLKERLISASVISHEKQGIFSEVFCGFILQVPATLIMATCPNEDFEDLHTRNRFETLEELEKEVERITSLHPLYQPDELLEKTPEKW